MSARYAPDLSPRFPPPFIKSRGCLVQTKSSVLDLIDIVLFGVFVFGFVVDVSVIFIVIVVIIFTAVAVVQNFVVVVQNRRLFRIAKPYRKERFFTTKIGLTAPL